MSEVVMEKVSGKIGAIAFRKENPSGWTQHDAVLANGKKYVLGIPPNGHVPAVGESVNLKPAKFGTWALDMEEQAQNGSGVKKASGGANDRENYWQNKSMYEETVRDPKIEFQTYYAQACMMYAAAMPYLEEKPINPEEVNAYMDLAYAKACLVYAEVTAE